MAHYALINENNIVEKVITGVDESNFDWESCYGNITFCLCKRTSYSGSIRKNFAGIGYTFDSGRDAFIPPKPFASWVLNETTCQWEAPSAKPVDANFYAWDEGTTAWVQKN